METTPETKPDWQKHEVVTGLWTRQEGRWGLRLTQSHELQFQLRIATASGAVATVVCDRTFSGFTLDEAQEAALETLAEVRTWTQGLAAAELQRRVAALEAQVEMLRKALEFYANAQDGARRVLASEIRQDVQGFEVLEMLDKVEVARKALARLQEGGA